MYLVKSLAWTDGEEAALWSSDSEYILKSSGLISFFKGRLGGMITFVWQYIISGEHVFTFCWITQLYSSYQRAGDIFILNCRQPHVDNEPILWFGLWKDCENALFCVIFFSFWQYWYTAAGRLKIIAWG